MVKVLIADDEEITLKVLKEELSREGYEVDTAIDGAQALQKINKCIYDVIILDIRMPKKDGLKVLKEIKNENKSSILIMMTAFGSIKDAVEAMKIGAYDFITKPFDNNELLEIVKQALKTKDKIFDMAKGNSKIESIVGASVEIQKLKQTINKIKDLDATVLITGESGTGKGVVAKSIHKTGNRKGYPFVHVNCAVLPPTLIESELFGHEKGSYTGAIQRKIGKFESAGQGTIFLDEISAISPNLQAKLLTAIQEKKISRIGSSEDISINARIIAATNENLEEAIRKKRFRADLYYRLNIINIECPPLRYHKVDLDDLTLYFLTKFNKKYNKRVKLLSTQVTKILYEYDWPGNVRELENVIECSVALTNGNELCKEDLPIRICKKFNDELGEVENKSLSIFKINEMEAIKNALKNNNGHREKTANELGISRRALQYKLKEMGIV